MYVRCVSVLVVALYEHQELGGIRVECDGLEKLFSFSLLLVKMPSDTFLFSACTVLVTSCEGSWRLMWFLVRILCLMFLLDPRLKCLIAPVGIWCLFCLVIFSVRFGGCVNVGEVFYVEVCIFGVYILRERVPICSVSVSVGALTWRC